MLKYTRWIASCAPIESSPPLRMWWIPDSVLVERSQHLPSRSGSHQQAAGSAPAAHSATLRHLVISSFSNVGRRNVLMIALMVPGLLIWSVGTADVSVVPGRA